MKAPYGSWRSPITASRIAEGAVSLGWPQAVGAALYWVEMRPEEGGRYVVVRRAPDGLITDVTPAGVNARTLVHEYGGGMYEAFATAAAAEAGEHAGGDASGGRAGGEAVVFSAFDDQRLYRQDLEDGGGGAAARWSAPRPLTPEPPAPRAFRYADGRVTPDRRRFFSVRERHLADEVVNDLVVLPAGDAGEPAVVASGHDFFSSPRPSPDGHLLAGLCWDHPNMPWDDTELWVATLDEERPSDVGRPRGRRRGGVRRTAAVGAGRRAALRQRPQRLVEPLPYRAGRAGRRAGGRGRGTRRPRARRVTPGGTAGHGAGSGRRTPPDGGRVRQAAVGVRGAERRLPAGRQAGGLLHPRRSRPFGRARAGRLPSASSTAS